MASFGVLQATLLLSLLFAIVVASSFNGEQYGISDLIKKYPQFGEALHRSLTRAKLLKPDPVVKNNETSFVEWIQHLKEGKDYIEKPRDASLDIIRTSFLTVHESDVGVEVSEHAKECRVRAFAFAYVGCNRMCNRLVDLFINCCSAERTEQLPGWAMSELCCPEMLKKNE